MIEIITGDDRIRASQEIEQFLGKDHETIEGIDLTPGDLPSIFYGASLFAKERNILIRDLSLSKEAFDMLPDYLNSPHNIIIQELKLDKRSSTYKTLKDKIKIKTFDTPKNPNLKLVFDIYRVAKTNGKKAIEMLDKIKTDEDPIMFFGLLASQAIKDYKNNQGRIQKNILKELAEVDLQMKSSSLDSWLLIESFLLRLSRLQK